MHKFDNSKCALFFTFYIKLLSVSQKKSRKNRRVSCQTKTKSKYRLLRKLRADLLRRIEVLLKFLSRTPKFTTEIATENEMWLYWWDLYGLRNANTGRE